MSAILSRVRIELPPQGVAPRGATAEYLLHQGVAALFEAHPGRPYLYRDLTARGATREILVLSSVPPRHGRTGPGPQGWVRELEQKPYEPALRAGQILGFDLLLNATTVARVPSEGGERKVRRDVWDARFMSGGAPAMDRLTPYREYLTRRVGGVAILVDLALLERRLWRVRRRLGDPAMQFVVARLVGRLEVSDPQRLVDLVVTGIGRGKGFGCGLLCLLPAARLPSRRTSR